MLIREVVLGCALIVPHHTVSALRVPFPDALEDRVDAVDPDHSHGELNAEIMAYAYGDVHSPVVTGAMIPASAELQAANRALSRWWARTPLGHRLTLPELIKLAFQKQAEGVL